MNGLLEVGLLLGKLLLQGALASKHTTQLSLRGKVDALTHHTDNGEKTNLRK